ncbi:PD-(D/E)XK motif protein [Cupriavidus necator]|uniref:PD-(D/E)XK motif protein n=1 Tax=Cupriavidus necator TaxID=106590 RepID=UPI003F7371A5
MLSVTAGQAENEAWVFREDGRFGVAVPLVTNLRVQEFFAGAKLGTVERDFGGHVRTLLRLDSGCEALRNEFAVVCAQFIDPGIDGQERVALTANPLEWWNRWRQLLGNSNRDRRAYSSLGELLALERLRSQGIDARWIGPLQGSVDIEATGASYEVKSTLSRYGSVVHIAGQFQLNRSKHVPLHLIHQRFEPSTVGDSIDSVIRRLIECGMAVEELESSLARDGLHAGGAARAETYRLLESTVYAVNDEFPGITPSSFSGGVVPAGILSIEYDVDLSALHGQPF